MTQLQKVQIMAFVKIINSVGQRLLKIAEELNDKDVDTAILIADSVRNIANGNCAILDHINDVTNSLDHEINLEQSFEDFKKTLSVSIPYGPEDCPTIDMYDPLDPAATRHASKEINQFIS